MKYTPGPWTHCSCARCELVWAADGETLIHDTPGDEECMTAKGEEAQANALLIAAAPELYEALKELLVAVKSEPVMNNTKYDAIGAKVLSALKKAEEGRG